MREIVFISRKISDIGGIPGQMFRLAENLYERRVFRPVLVCPDRNCGFAGLFIEAGFEVFDVPMEKTEISSTAKKIIHILENRDVAVIQSHLFRESLIARAVRKRRPDIRHVFRAQTYIDGSSIPRWQKNLHHILDKITSRWVDCYVVNGQYLADEIVNRSKVNPNKVIALLNGRNQIGPPDKPCDKPNEPLPARIAMVANFRPVKGHDCLIKALALLKKRNLPITARLIGGESAGNVSDKRNQNTKSAIRKLSEELGVSEQVEFYGSTKDVFGAIEEIPVVVLPANSEEGVPNCLLEAMSVRKLVIASKMNGVGEIIKHGKTGLLHKPKDFIALAEILEKIFTTPAEKWEQMRNQALQIWQEKFTLDKMTDKLVNIYRELGLINHD